MHCGLGRRHRAGANGGAGCATGIRFSLVTSPCSEIGHCEGERLFGTAAEIKPGLAAATRSKCSSWLRLCNQGQAGP